MVNMLFRAVIFYILLTVFMRFMGKRQIGEMQMSEFVTMIFLSELAVLPVTDGDIPLLNGLLPLAVISSGEVMISYFSSRSEKFARVVSGNAIPLMANGEFVEKNLKRTRISREDVEAQIRIEGFKSSGEIETVILERTGKMSILPYSEGSRCGGRDG